MITFFFVLKSPSGKLGIWIDLKVKTHDEAIVALVNLKKKNRHIRTKLDDEGYGYEIIPSAFGKPKYKKKPKAIK